ncbi:MAG: hypothetical protein ACE5FT_05140 [Candidatus Nanoarchaeia archaeon]
MTKTKSRSLDGNHCAPSDGAQTNQLKRERCINQFVQAPTGGAQAKQKEPGGCIL